MEFRIACSKGGSLTEANRLQIFFEDKPDKPREGLKSNGFRWSPKPGHSGSLMLSYYAADYIKGDCTLPGKAYEVTTGAYPGAKNVTQEQPVQEQPEQETPQDKDTFSVYQIKGGDETKGLAF